ncbi:MAG: molybdopterin-guanine dinucleotide biosynthesis protein B [Proteobacteria bacterium]|nr:molybdopterin-guanine dinucleotide biosynthesis protein B [Pseudomonadota bacterium]
MKLLHVIGRKNNGKTKLVVDIIKELTERGLDIGSIKHSSHDHELDKPGKDSFLHREAGASPSTVITPTLTAIFIPRRGDDEPLKILSPLYENKDLVVVEGYLEGPGKKIEVWRNHSGEPPIAPERNDIKAIVTDDPIDIDCPVWPREDIKTLCDHILKLMEIK